MFLLAMCSPSYFNIPEIKVAYVKIISLLPPPYVINVMVHLTVDGVSGREKVEQSISSCLNQRHQLTTFTYFPPYRTHMLIKEV